MPRANQRPPSELIQSISTKAESVQNAAAELTARIERFQEFLSRLPGRVETDFYGWHPDAISEDDAHNMSLVLRLHREGKDWILSCGTHHKEAEHLDPFYSVRFRPLDEASIKWKMAAVKQFPDLLQAIEKSQDKFVEELKKVAADYDSFESTLKPSAVPTTAVQAPPTAAKSTFTLEQRLVVASLAAAELSRRRKEDK
jgi:hypothetical protein